MFCKKSSVKSTQFTQMVIWHGVGKLKNNKKNRDGYELRGHNFTIVCDVLMKVG